MKLNLDEQLDIFKLYLKKQGNSQNTILSYLTSLRLYLSLYSELDVDSLRSYREYLLSRYRANTVNTRIHGINRFLDCISSRPEDLPYGESPSEYGTRKLLCPVSCELSGIPEASDIPDTPDASGPAADMGAVHSLYYKEVSPSKKPSSGLQTFRLKPLRPEPSPQQGYPSVSPGSDVPALSPSAGSLLHSAGFPDRENTYEKAAPNGAAPGKPYSSALSPALSPGFMISPEADFQPLPEQALQGSGHSSYKLNTVKKQQKTYLDSVISQRDYEKLKKRLKKDNNYFWYFVVRFLGATGARVSELLQIKVENLKSGHLDLYSKGGKVRRLYLPRRLCDEALPWFEARGIKSGFIFLNHHGQPITSRGIGIQLKQLAVRYHIEPDTVYPHSFRHRFAKNFLKKFNDISLLADLMGHDSIETTRIYLTRSSEEQKELLDRIITW